jgi:hypothetical protein
MRLSAAKDVGAPPENDREQLSIMYRGSIGRGRAQ